MYHFLLSVLGKMCFCQWKSVWSRCLQWENSVPRSRKQCLHFPWGSAGCNHLWNSSHFRESFPHSSTGRLVIDLHVIIHKYGIIFFWGTAFKCLSTFCKENFIPIIFIISLSMRLFLNKKLIIIDVKFSTLKIVL